MAKRKPFDIEGYYLHQVLSGPGVGSFNRARVLLEHFDIVEPAEWFIVAGHEWSCCDRIGLHRRAFAQILRSASRRELNLMMTVQERAALAKMPREILVYRGCYRNNRRGLSWSLDRDIAQGFPSLARFAQDGQARLLTGVARKSRAVLKLDREEEEIIAADVTILNEELIPSTR